MRVRGVQVDGRAAEFLHDDGELVVALGRSLALGDAVEVEVALEGQLAQRPSGHSYWLLALGPGTRARSWRGTTAGLVATLDELTGGDWQPWFERYVYGTEVPRLPR